MLDVVVRQVDEGAAAGLMPELSDIAAGTGLADEVVAAALLALADEFIDLETTAGDVSAWFVKGVVTRHSP